MRRQVQFALLAAVVLFVASAAGCAVDLGMSGGDDPSGVTGGVSIGGASMPIVNGEATTEFPTVGVLLTGSDPSWLVCSGTLIGCDRFLTAAHCVCYGDGASCQDTAPVEPMRVFLQNAGFFDVVAQHVHPDFSFPDSDVAVLELDHPALGVRPSPLAAAPPLLGQDGVIVGFGRSGGGEQDYGIKQFGPVVTSACPDGMSLAGHVCWTYLGDGANTCHGDSGGPLFVPDGSGGRAVAGVTSGGTRGDCLAGDQSYDNEVSGFADYIAGVSGGAEQVGQSTCGDLPHLGDEGTAVFSQQGTLPAGRSADFVLNVPAGTSELRVGLNSTEGSNADLYIRAGDSASALHFDCAADGPDSYGFCRVTAPVTGDWDVLVHAVGAGDFQLTTTALSGAPGALADSYGIDVDEALVVGAEAGVLSNDSAAGNGPLTAAMVSRPAHGALELRPDGSFTYTPLAGYSGDDSFTYRASDGLHAGSARVAIAVAAPPPEPGDTAVDDGDADGGADESGGCSAAGGARGPGWMLLALSLGLAGARRRRRRRGPPPRRPAA